MSRSDSPVIGRELAIALCLDEYTGCDEPETYLKSSIAEYDGVTWKFVYDESSRHLHCIRADTSQIFTWYDGDWHERH